MWLLNSFQIIFAICLIQIVPIQSNELSKGVTDFAWDLYDECAKSKPGNVIISPLSVATSLALLSQAAGGGTFDELRQGLHLNSSDKTAIANNFYNFHTQLQENLGNSTFSLVNRIYVRTDLKLNKTYEDVATTKFHSGVESVDFGDKPKTAATISKFVEDNTNGKIKDFVTADSLSTDLVTIIVNAIYFQGNWETPFNKRATYPSKFFVNENESISTDFMSQFNFHNHAKLDDLNAAALELKYKNSKFTFVIVLPNSRTGLSELETKIKDYGLENIRSRMTTNEKIILKLPKFKVEYSIDLRDVLENLGMRSMYTGSADLNGLLESTDKVGSLMVSKVIHKAFIDVNEVGSEAGAATSLQIVSRTFHPTFTANHPFLYYIYDTETGTIAFSGRIVTVEPAKPVDPVDQDE